MQKQKQSRQQQFRDETVLALPQAMPAHNNLTMDPGVLPAGRTKAPAQVEGGGYRLTTSTQTPDWLEPDSDDEGS